MIVQAVEVVNRDTSAKGVNQKCSHVFSLTTSDVLEEKKFFPGVMELYEIEGF